MAKAWFCARHHGWGWTPANIEGWLVLVIALLAVCWWKGERPRWRWGGK